MIEPSTCATNIQCVGCGTIFMGDKARKYCNNECYNATRTKRNIERTCQECGGFFTVTPSVIRDAEKRGYSIRSCSRVCHKRAQAERRIERTCLECGGSFTVDAGQLDYQLRTGKRRAVFCSDACRSKNLGKTRRNRITVYCEICGVPLERTPSKVKSQERHFCSYACAGVETPNWSITPGYKHGYRDDLGHYVRSSWEANVARFFKYMGWSYDYEPTRFDLGDCTYLPDFFMNGYYVEVKGQWRPDAREKLRRFEVMYPDVHLEIIDKHRYKELGREFSERIPEWEYQKVPACKRGGDRRRKDVRERLGLNRSEAVATTAEVALMELSW